MTQPRLAVMRHWRAEVEDVARTLRDACQPRPDPPLGFSNRARAFADLARGRVEDLGLLFSDSDASRLVEASFRAGRRPHIFRLWWNEAEQIEAFVDQRHRVMDPGAETQICFFPEILTELPALAGRLLYAPYVFTTPKWQPSPRPENKVCFTSEVNVSNSYLTAVLEDPDDVERYSTSVWQTAQEVVDGRRTMEEADRVLLMAHGGTITPLYRALLSATRSRVRYLLLGAVVAAFPQRVKVRGSDWKALGFDALPTTRGPFRKWERLSDYRRHRVSLDLGSKCTNAALSPRAADIMAVGGGIVRFGSGVAPDSRLAILGEMTADTRDGLLALIESVLSLDGRELMLRNREIHDQYRQARLDIGLGLAAALGNAVAGRAVGSA